MVSSSAIIPDYLRDPQAIYQESFRQIAELVNLSPYPQSLHPILLRLIHSSGRIEILQSLRYSSGWHDESIINDLHQTDSILTDSEMTRAGITQKFLPPHIRLACHLNDDGVAEQAQKSQTTRSAAAVDCWQADPKRAIAVIGNAPTALFRLLENIQDGKFQPCLIIGFPVGFVGAIESKALLSDHPDLWQCDWITLTGREGGSALASAALNGIFAPPIKLAEQK